MLARELMTGYPAVVTGDDSLRTAADEMRTHNVGLLPVVADTHTRRLIGVITDRDIVIRGVAHGHGAGAKVRDHMTAGPLHTVDADDSADEIATVMRRHQVRRLPVVDAKDSVIGIVAQADLALTIGPQDPLLVERTIESISRPAVLMG